MIKDIVSFFRNPYSYLNSTKSETSKEKISTFKNVFFFCICSSFSALLFTNLVIEPIIGVKLNISITKNLSNNIVQFRESNSLLGAYFKSCIFGPFEEEVRFRLILISRSFLLRFIILLGWMEYFLPDTTKMHFFSFEYYVTILIIITALVFEERSRTINQPLAFKKDTYNYLCWFSTVAFAAVHIGNYTPINWQVFYLYPIYVLPQLAYGLAFSYLAVKYNSLIWPFLLHVSINSTSEIPRFLNYIFH